jgi:hypothetical protein
METRMKNKKEKAAVLVLASEQGIIKLPAKFFLKSNFLSQKMLKKRQNLWLKKILKKSF